MSQNQKTDAAGFKPTKVNLRENMMSTAINKQFNKQISALKKNSAPAPNLGKEASAQMGSKTKK
jgi:hypothetical protein